MLESIKKSSSAVLKKTVILTVALFCGFCLTDIHRDYIRDKVGFEVVKIINPEEGGGTGVHVHSKSGAVYILTNEHICQMSKNGKPLYIVSKDFPELIPRKVIFMSQKHDICLIEPVPGHKGLELASGVDVGEKVTMAGHPELRPLSFEEGEIIDKESLVTIAKYIITSEESRAECTHKIVEVPTFFGKISVCAFQDNAYQAKIISYPGNSGSPVVNKWGNIVGLLFAGNSSAITDSYLVKLEHIKEILEIY